jgi:hypothetical protein
MGVFNNIVDMGIKRRTGNTVLGSEQRKKTNQSCEYLIFHILHPSFYFFLFLLYFPISFTYPCINYTTTFSYNQEITL